VERGGGTVLYVSSGVIRPRGSRAERLSVICRELEELCARFAPSLASLEKSFVGDNVQTAFRLGEARGAAMVAAARCGVGVSEYSPAEVKLAVAGSGRASKLQMQTMVGKLLRVQGTLLPDEADALGLAICHAHSSVLASAVGAGSATVGRRSARSPRSWLRR
jgi:crossover junction endodeoxyribonuclease RuvC